MSGIYLASRWALPPALLGLAALLPLSVAWLWRREARPRLFALCGLFLLLGGLRYALSLPRFDEDSVSAYNDKGWGTLVGTVIAEPDRRDTYANLRLRAETLIRDGSEPREVGGLVLVRAPRYPEPLYGDRLRVRGTLETPPVFEGFSYRDYLSRQGIYSTVRWARIDTLERGRGNPLFARMLVFKRRAQTVIADILPEPCAALLTGILLGDDGGMPAGLTADFRTTGTSHIIAISGFNFAVISGVLSSLSVRLVGRRYAAWFATGAIALYAVLVGGSAAVVRAALMGCIAVWGEHLGRQNAAPNALFAAALGMTAWNPHILWDLGFLLSFAATLGLILYTDPLQRAFEGLLARLLPPSWVEPTSRSLKEPLVLTTCAQLTTMPIILYNFRVLSTVTLLSNALILPAQTQVMLWGALATVGGLIWLPLGRVLGWVAWLFLAYTVWVVETTAGVRHAAVELGRVSSALVWGWYAILGIGAWWMAQTGDKRKAAWRTIVGALAGRQMTAILVGGLGLVAVLVWAGVASLPDGRLHVAFLDVGDGDATWIETPSGGQVLVNGGPSPSAMAAHLGRRMPFWDRTLDLVVLTDWREEHLAGLIPVLERYEVGQVLRPPGGCTRATCIRWEKLLHEKGIPVLVAVAGTRADLGNGAVLTVLHPDGAGKGSGGDEPLVLRVDYGRACSLFAGSAGRDAEAAMLARGEGVRCDVLQVGDHGGSEATSPVFLEAVYPALAVISCGEGGPAAQPDEAVLERLNGHGATVVRTDEAGTVEVISDGQGYEVAVGR